MSNFINQLDIKAFRKIQDLSLTGLGRVNLFVGENDSGKSSILEAIQLFCNPMDPIEIMSLAHYRESERELDSAMAALGFVPLSSLGDGIRRVLSYAISLSESQAGVLLIDEIETAIHKDALSKVFRWLLDASKKLDVQIFATTHSLEAIDAILGASLSCIDDLVVFQLPDRGKTEVKHFSPTALRVVIDGC